MGSQLNSQAMSANFAARSKSRPGGVSSRPRARFNFLLLNLIRPFSQKNTGNKWKQQTNANSWKILKDNMKDAERAKTVTFLLCAERAGGARWQEGKKVDKRMRLLSSQSAARRQCHGCTSQFVHICPKSSDGSCAADLLSWELALKVPGRLLCACNTPKQMQQQMEAGAGGFSRKKMNN